ncbi:MAG: M24 family metallopeptidase [Deltaproteobacteria bacterium]|nr:M24 family metallopeptidase [Deltaproteobacteria bacterium]
MAKHKLIPELTQKEKERRWSLLREQLKKSGLSALIVYGETQLGVPLHYLSQVWGTKMNMLVFPVDSDPVLFIPSNTIRTGRLLVEQGCWLPEENIRLSVNTAVDAAKLIIDRRLHKDRIGIDSFRFWPVYEHQAFTELCPDAQLVEAHRLFGEIRGPKSNEELDLIQKAIRISDLAHYTFLANLKPGLTEEEAANAANEILTAYDIIDRIILIHSRPELVYPGFPGPTIIEKPNPVTFSPEFTRRLGYGAQMIRAYWWEKPKGEFKKMFELWAEMRQMIEQEFRPGVEITAAGKKIQDLVNQWGFECDKLGHAVGLAYGDAPYITAGPNERDHMEWTILTNEVYAVHPMVRGRGGMPPFSMIGDMYFIGKDETTRMTTALSGLPEMIP